jgi:hypothetical protein
MVSYRYFFSLSCSMIDISLVSSHMDVKLNLKVKAHREQPHTRLVMTDMSRTTAI